MLYFHKEKLVILCQPKTGTTALHEAIFSQSSIAFNTPPHMKHMTYGKFMRVLAPWISGGGEFARPKYTMVCVMREPIEWFGSWYRYNSRDALASPQNRSHSRYTGNISFNDYLEALLLPKDEMPDYAKLGGPCSIAMDNQGRIGVDHLFPYTAMDNLVDFVSSKLGKTIRLSEANISVKRGLEADPATMEKVRQKFKFEFDVYAKLRSDGVVSKELKAIANIRKEELKAESDEA